MEEKAIVYWSPPCEWPSLRNTVEEMKKNNLVKTRLIADKVCDHINPGDKVGVKLHMGESGCTRYIRHDYIREVVDTIKSKGGIPTLIETQGIGLINKFRDITDNYNRTREYYWNNRYNFFSCKKKQIKKQEQIKQSP